MSEQISIAHLRAVTQPDSVRGRANAEHWVADLYLRKLSPYLTRILLRLHFSPNATTWLMIATGLCAAWSLLIPGILGVTLALLLGQLQMLFDCCDGEIARWKKQFSPTGIFLDKLGHYLTEACIAFALGLRIAEWPNQKMGANNFPLIGALLAAVIILNKSLNDAVHVSRYFSGLPKLEDRKSTSQSRVSWVTIAKGIFKYLPIHRAFHSVELTILIFIITLSELIFNIVLFESILTWIIPVILLVFVGHLISILTSNKLRDTH